MLGPGVDYMAGRQPIVLSRPAGLARRERPARAYCCADMNAPSSPTRRRPDPGGAGDSDRQRLQRMLGAPELSWLVDRIRVRLERGEPVDGTVTLVGATAEQRRAAGRLLGHGMGRGTSLSIPLPEVEAALRRAGAAPDLRAAVESLIGPVRDRAAERATEVRQFQDGLDAARRSPLAAEGWHLAWLEEISRDGSLSRLARHGQGNLLAQANAVLERLPTGIDEPAAALPALAEAVTGDPKALEGTPLAGLVLRALARREGVPAPAWPGGGAGPVDGGGRGRRRPGQPGPRAQHPGRRRRAGRLADGGRGGRGTVPDHAAPAHGHADHSARHRPARLREPGGAAGRRGPTRRGQRADRLHRGRAVGGLSPAAAVRGGDRDQDSLAQRLRLAGPAHHGGRDQAP